MFDFRFNTPIPSLNQDQGIVFTIWECAQSISCIESHLKMIILENFLTSDPLGVILCGESIARIPEFKKASLTLIQGRNRYIEAKIKHFQIFMRKQSILRFFQARNRLRAFPNLENASLTLIQGRNRCIEAKINLFWNYCISSNRAPWGSIRRQKFFSTC